MITGAGPIQFNTYIKKSLEYLTSAGIEAPGVTSPWVFGIEVEQEYIHAITTAQYEVYNAKSSWDFLQMLHQNSAARPGSHINRVTVTPGRDSIHSRRLLVVDH